MSAVEDKIVSMKFDNKQFESGARTSMSTLDRLKAALNFGKAGKSLGDLQNTASKFNLNGLGSAATGIGGKFTAMSAVALAAIGSITVKAVDAGLKIANALTLAPVKAGFQEYETNLNAVQTILANTQASGAGLKDVNAALSELNTYSDKTIYNFSEMARNIGTFTAAGVDLSTATQSIKGIANLAALSGSNSQQASTAMYQLSQAISSGRVSLQDWNSVVNAGMGGTVFQRALAQTAENMGTLDKGAVKLTGKMKNATINGKSFRESITAKPGEKSWLTSAVLTSTLKQFTGDMTDAQLRAMGFKDDAIASIQAQAKTASDAATQVKTFSQLIGTLQESAGSGFAQTFQILLGDFEEAKKLFTEVNNIAGGFISNSAKARNKMLQDWKDLGGRTKAIESLRNVFKAIVAVITPIGQAFREIFPATTGKQLFDLTSRFLEFTKTLKIGADTAKNLKRTFAGVFAIFSIAISLIKAVGGVILDFFGVLGQGSGDFLSITASIGDFLVKLDQTIKKGDLFNKFFAAIGKVLKSALGGFKEFGPVLDEFFGKFKSNPFDAFAAVLQRIRDRLAPLAGTTSLIGSAFDLLIRTLSKVGNFLKPVIDYISKAFSSIGSVVAQSIKTGDFSGAFDALNTGLLAGLVLIVKNFLDKGINIDFGGGLVKGITKTFGALTDTLSAMQTQIQAKTLILIAGAVALLTASIVALSLIDSGKLTKALAAMAVAFGQLLTAMAILTKISGTAGFLKVPVIAGSLILLATAVLILTAAVKNLSDLNWEELSKGLIGVGALLAMIVLTSKGLEKSSGSMIRVGLALIPLAIGIKILASAVKDFGNLSWGEMAKGLVGIGAALVIIAGAMQLMPKGLILQAAGLLILSVALNAIALALNSLGGMSWEGIAKALVALAGALVIMAAALYLMSAALPGAAALIVAAGALAILAPVLLILSTLSWEGIAKGMVALAGALLILAGGLTLMSAALPGAAALVVAAAALAILAPVLVVLGAMSWQAIATGLGAIAGAFVVLGVAGLVLAPLVPAIIALSAALLLLGVATTLIGVGLLAIATAFSVFAAAGTVGLSVLLGMINLIPQFMTQFAVGIIAFATTIASQATVFVGAFVALLTALLDAVITVAPKIKQAFDVLMALALGVLIKNVPKLAAAGLKLIIAVLTAISNNIGKITAIAAQLIVNFINGISSKLGSIIQSAVDLILKFMAGIQSAQGQLLQAGASMIIAFINNLASTIRDNQGAMNSAGSNLASAIISGMTSGIFGGISSVIGAAVSVARSAISAAKDALGINSPSKEFYALGAFSAKGLAIGIERNGSLVESAATRVARTTLDTVSSALSHIADDLPNDMSINPIITPVLDLSKVTKGAAGINTMLDGKAIQANVSYMQALGVSNTRAPVEEAAATVVPAGDTFVELHQTNNSPKAIGAVEIYRATKSQLALAKEAIDKS